MHKKLSFIVNSFDFEPTSKQILILFNADKNLDNFIEEFKSLINSDEFTTNIIKDN